MKKKELYGYRDLQREARLLKRRCAEWKRRLDACGDSDPELLERARQISECLERQQLRVLDEQLRIERLVEQIPDSLLRQIFTLRYLEGLSWQAIAQQVGGANEDSLRIMHERYLKTLVSEKICV